MKMFALEIQMSLCKMSTEKTGDAIDFNKVKC